MAEPPLWIAATGHNRTVATDGFQGVWQCVS